MNSTGASEKGMASADKKKEIYTYEAPWTIYAMNWSMRRDMKFRLAIGSFIEEYTNRVQIVQLDEATGKFEEKGSFEHPYPSTKIMWAPEKLAMKDDLIATSGDYLRLWKVDQQNDKVELESVLNNVSG